MNEIETKKTDIVEYSPVEQRLGELRAKYSEVPDTETADGYEACRVGLRELVTCRTDIEKKRKEIKAPLLEKTKLIDSEAKRITAAILEIEEPLKSAKALVDDRVAREKAEAERRERERVEGIESVLFGFERAAVDAVGMNSAGIKTKIEQAENYVVSEQYFQEFTGRVERARLLAISELRELYDKKVEAEAAELRLAEERAELERQKAEIEAARLALQVEREKAQETLNPTPEIKQEIQSSEAVAADLKAGIVTTAGPVIDEESPEEQAAKALAFACSLGNEQAREVVAMIKTGNIPFVCFHTFEDFSTWWEFEGSGMSPKANEDAEEHAERVCKVAWANAEFKAFSENK